MRKIEIIARITGDDAQVEEETLMTWTDTGHWYPRLFSANVLLYPDLEIRLHQRRVLKDGKDVHLSRYEYGVLIFLAQCWRREIATIFCREYLTNFCRKSRSQQNK